MPEGDTIFRAAETMHRALAGHVVTAFESVYPSLTRIDAEQPLAGRTIEAVAARGKHLLITFSGHLMLRTHMRMHGSWHLYRPGERWQRPARDMRIVIGTAAFVAVAFDVPDAEFISGGNASRHRVLEELGPDLLAPSFDRAEATKRLGRNAATFICDALLDQRLVAGIGNVFKSEVLFMAGVNPFASVGSLGGDVIERLLDVAVRQLRSNVAPGSRRLTPARGRRTTGSLHPTKGLWVYGRAGEPCRKCGTPIALRKHGRDARLTYWCPACQRQPS